MGNESFPFSPHLFGQSTILLDICRFIQTISKNMIRIYIISSGRLSYKPMFSSDNVNYIQIADPIDDLNAYYDAVYNIVKNNAYVPS
jgi:hypothetical protein